MKLTSFLATLPHDLNHYLGTTTGKVVPVVMGLTGTIGSIDPTPITSAITRVMPLLHLTPHATHIVGTALTGVAVVHALFSKSPQTPHQDPPGPSSGQGTDVLSAPESAKPQVGGTFHTSLSTVTDALAFVRATLGTTSSPSTSGTLIPAKLSEETPVSNMPQMVAPTEPVTGTNPSWVNTAETIGADIQSSLPVLNEVLAMVTALTGKSIPGLATGETIALAILSDVNSFASGKSTTTPTVTFTVAGVKLSASLTVQKV